MGLGFQGVAQGMAEIEQAPFPGFPFVRLYHPAFDIHRPINGFGKIFVR